MTVRRRWLLWLWFGYLLFILYGVSLPFDIDWHQAPHKWQDFIVHPLDAEKLSLPDFLSNFLLFVPFGILLGTYWRDSRTSSLAAVLGGIYTFLAGVAFLALFLLWQVFLSLRNPFS